MSRYLAVFPDGTSETVEGRLKATELLLTVYGSSSLVRTYVLANVRSWEPTR